MEITDTKPLFTLTAEETKFVKYVLGRYERDYEKDEWEGDMLWQIQQKIKEYEGAKEV